MKKTRKITSLLLTIVIFMSMGCLGTFAADYPPILELTALEQSLYPLGNNIPNSIQQIRLPGESQSFTYSFANKKIQYSDFIFIPNSNTTTIKINFVATSASHNVTLNIKNIFSGATTFTDIVTISQGYEGEIILPYGSYTANQGYYIEISVPSANGASGVMTVY